jgi:hypothetical protein
MDINALKLLFFIYKGKYGDNYDKSRSKITGRFRQESTGNRWNVEAVFPPETFRIFSDDFRPVPAGKHRKSTGIHRKKPNKFPVGILLPLPAISGAFLQDPATFPLLFCGILRDPVAVIIDLGTCLNGSLVINQFRSCCER